MKKNLRTSEELSAEVRKIGSPARAKTSAGFFKIGKGEYGEGDVFAGITVPDARAIAKRCDAMSLAELKKALASRIHEERLVALLQLVTRFASADAAGRKRIFDFYLNNLKGINNWDLVDTSADKIVGAYVSAVPEAWPRVEKLSRSKNIWARRISMIMTFYFIKKGDPAPAYRMAAFHLNDSHDLMHKATGWMLREAGKRCGEKGLQAFLSRHAASMPRTALRYAIERFSEPLRKKYLSS